VSNQLTVKPTKTELQTFLRKSEADASNGDPSTDGAVGCGTGCDMITGNASRSGTVPITMSIGIFSPLSV
jgi:hypothetical protein